MDLTLLENIFSEPMEVKLRLDAEMQKGLIGIKGGAVGREQIYTD